MAQSNKKNSNAVAAPAKERGSAGKQRKEARRDKQSKAQMLNNKMRSDGVPTPWEWAKAARAERRSKDPRVIRARRLHMADALKMPTDAGRQP